MPARKILAIAIVSLASIIVVVAAVLAIAVFAPLHTKEQRNFAPESGQQAVSPVGNMLLFSQTDGDSSFLYKASTASGQRTRLTSTKSGIESEASFSHDGKYIVYCFAEDASARSQVRVVALEGRDAREITPKTEDALHPVFSPDDTRIFYAVSGFSGNYSPIVRPARHSWDVYSVAIKPEATGSLAKSMQVTHSSFYDLRSMDVSADEAKPGATRLLISTVGYPIGDLLQEFVVEDSGRDEIFQPHVPGEPTVGPSYGDARFIHRGTDVIFLAATDGSDGKYDYNVFSMSNVTGKDLKQLTHLKGVTRELRVLPDGNAVFVNDGSVQLLDMTTLIVKRL